MKINYVTLNQEEYKYLNQNNFLPKDNKTFEIKTIENKIQQLNITIDQASEIRNNLCIKLQEIGFNSDDEITKDGKKIEELINKFFISL